MGRRQRGGGSLERARKRNRIGLAMFGHHLELCVVHMKVGGMEERERYRIEGIGDDVYRIQACVGCVCV